MPEPPRKPHITLPEPPGGFVIPEDLKPAHDRAIRELKPLREKALAWKAWHEGGEHAEEPPKPTPAEYDRIITLARAILDMRKGRAPIESEDFGELRELLGELSADLSRHFADRYAQFGKPNPPTIRPESIRLPETLTSAHLEAINETFPNAFEPRILPTTEDLNNLDQDYIDVMYPANQSEADERAGLTSYRPSWWNKRSEHGGTWGERYTASMYAELKEIGGSLALIDTAIKPIYDNGNQYYGTQEGNNPDADPLLPLFRHVFGSKANRFEHSWQELADKLLPEARAQITEAFKAKGLPIPNFNVTLIPAVADNQHMTFHQPESSQTNTWEWTLTTLLDERGADTARRLHVGGADHGGAGYVDRAVASGAGDDLGARLAVVFLP